MSLLRSAYGIANNLGFSQYFSKASVENLLLYVMAKLGHDMEEYVDAHEKQVEEYIAAMKPHTLRWYVQKILDFQYNAGVFDAEYGTYDNTNVSESDLNASKIVKYASATESTATLYIKVAGETGGEKAPLTSSQLAALQAYVANIKDAGVRVEIINSAAAHMYVTLTVHYDPLILNASGQLLSDNSIKPVEDAIKAYIANLPFNGIFSKDALVDAIQQAQGVKVTDLQAVYVSADGTNYQQMAEAYTQPYSGYYQLNTTDTVITYTPYQY